MDETDETNLLVRLTRRMRLEEKLRSARNQTGFDLALQAKGDKAPASRRTNTGYRGSGYGYSTYLNVDAYRLFDHSAMLAILDDLPARIGTPVRDSGAQPQRRRPGGIRGRNERSSTRRFSEEGLVLRPLVEEYDEDIGGRLSFKVINPRFVLKYDA